ncbi:MAG: hypothetical protein ABSC56_10155 [Solirubrobacteraceae bacterium]
MSPTSTCRRAYRVAAAMTLASALVAAPPTLAATKSPSSVAATLGSATTTLESGSSDSLETAASRASETGRTIAFSLIGLALAVTSVILVFRRDFKEAVGALAIGVIAVLLASPVGLSVLQDTVSTLFGSS